MKTVFSPSLDKQIDEINRTKPQLLPKIAKQIKLFQIDPKHPSLRNHKLSGSLSNVWSISIDMRLRMLYKIRSDGSAYFFNLGTHDEVYRK